MNQTLKEAIRAVEALPEADQEELANALLTLVERRRVMSRLTAAEKRGGATSAEDFLAELTARYGR
jgi:hypothetical protein